MNEPLKPAWVSHPWKVYLESHLCKCCLLHAVSAICAYAIEYEPWQLAFVMSYPSPLPCLEDVAYIVCSQCPTKLLVVSICEPKQSQFPLTAIESAWPPHNAFWSEQDEPQEILGSPSSSTLYPNSSSQIPIFVRIWRLAAMNVLNQQNVRAPCFVADKACPKRISSQSGRGAIVTTPQQPNLGKVRNLQLLVSLKTCFYSFSVANLLTCCCVYIACSRWAILNRGSWKHACSLP